MLPAEGTLFAELLPGHRRARAAGHQSWASSSSCGLAGKTTNRTGACPRSGSWWSGRKRSASVLLVSPLLLSTF